VHSKESMEKQVKLVVFYCKTLLTPYGEPVRHNNSKTHQRNVKFELFNPQLVKGLLYTRSQG
jgi:hypothetical protein